MKRYLLFFLYNSHFYLGIIDLINHRISIMDSMNKSSFHFIGLKKLNNILTVLAQLDNRIQVNSFEWCIPQNVPQQPNTFDCGIYAINFIEYLIMKDFSIFNYSSEYKRFKLNQLLEENVPYNQIVYTSNSTQYFEYVSEFNNFDDSLPINNINRSIQFSDL